MTIEEVGSIMKGMIVSTTNSRVALISELIRVHSSVPVNLKDRDAFHLTIEEYLQALISLIDELVRRNHLCVSHTFG